MAQPESFPSQQFVDIEEIRDDVLILKTHGLRKILIVSGINTELKSEEEQNMIYYAYQNFLNTLDFSLQMIVHSRKLNIEGYLDFLGERQKIEANELLKNGIEEYREFIKSFVADHDIMTKTFFAVVPFEPIAMMEKGALTKFLPSFLGKKKTTTEETAALEDRYEEHVRQLNQRTDQITAGLQAIGLRAVPLNKEELLELFYNLYNPKSTEKKSVNINQ